MIFTSCSCCHHQPVAPPHAQAAAAQHCPETAVRAPPGPPAHAAGAGSVIAPPFQTTESVPPSFGTGMSHLSSIYWKAGDVPPRNVRKTLTPTAILHTASCQSAPESGFRLSCFRCFNAVFLSLLSPLRAASRPAGNLLAAERLYLSRYPYFPL
jgi:hypothetical protein